MSRPSASSDTLAGHTSYREFVLAANWVELLAIAEVDVEEDEAFLQKWDEINDVLDANNDISVELKHLHRVLLLKYGEKIRSQENGYKIAEIVERN